jgi:WhiB family redox-sensing transcriptional regulator
VISEDLRGLSAARVAVLTRQRPAFLDDPARACLGADPRLFFPTSTSPAWTARAKAICRRCPFEDECREYAIGRCDEFGVWGATTFKDRVAIRRQRKRAGR